MCLYYRICAGLSYLLDVVGLDAGCVSRCIPAIYTRFGLFAGLPVAGLMMTGPADDDLKQGVSLCPKFWRSLIRAGKDHRLKIGAFFMPYILGLLRVSRFFWAVGVWWDCSPSFPLFVFPYPG